MDMNELKLTNKDIRERLECFVPPVSINEETILIYKRAYMAGSTKVLRLCLRDVMKRDRRLATGLLLSSMKI